MRNDLLGQALRVRVGGERPILVTHTDQPSNDFSVLFKTLESDPDSYLTRDPATFASAIGRSFYEQILPPDSVTLGWSSWAVQWLSRTPAIIPDHVQAAFSRDLAARLAYAKQASQDWESFLVNRGRELRSGGALVVLTMAVTETGDFGYSELIEGLYLTLEDTVGEGHVREEELRRMAIPTVGRSREDLLAPFAKDRGFAGFSVDHIDVFLVKDWIWEAFQQRGDAGLFGSRWASFIRAAVFPTLALGLDCEGDDPRVAKFLDRLERGVAARLAAAPAPMDIPLASIVLTKTGR